MFLLHKICNMLRERAKTFWCWCFCIKCFFLFDISEKSMLLQLYRIFHLVGWLAVCLLSIYLYLTRSLARSFIYSESKPRVSVSSISNMRNILFIIDFNYSRSVALILPHNVVYLSSSHSLPSPPLPPLHPCHLIYCT